MELHRIIKSDARRALRGCWGKSVAAAMIIFGAYLSVALAESVFLFVFSEDAVALDFLALSNASLTAIIITGGAALTYFLLMPALALGFVKLHFAFAEGREESVSAVFDMFSSFKSFVKSIVFTVAFSLRHAFCAAVALVPGGVLFYLAENYIVPENRTVHLLKISACCVGIALMLLCLALAFIYAQRWHAASYYFVSGRKVHESFKLSVRATKGRRVHIAGFKVSFVGWWLLNLLVLPVLWFVPYYSVSSAIYAKYLISKLEHAPVETPITGPEPEDETE